PTCRSPPPCWRSCGTVAAGSDQARRLRAQRRLVHLAARLLGQLVLAPEPEVARDLVAREPGAAVGEKLFRGDGRLRHPAGGGVRPLAGSPMRSAFPPTGGPWLAARSASGACQGQAVHSGRVSVMP